MNIDHRHKKESISTNSELIDDIKAERLPDDRPHLLTASTQSGGRGQHNRSWVSPVGNVYLSLYVPMQNPQAPNLQGLHRLTGALSLCVGLALWQLPIIQTLNARRTARQLPPIQVKWANDLGVYESSQALFNKLAGILIEPVFKQTNLTGVVIGVGLNITTAPIIKDGLYQAISLNCLSNDSHHPFDPNLSLSAKDLYLPIAKQLMTAIDTHNQYTTPQKHGICFDNNFINAFNVAHALTGKQVGIFEQDSMSTPSMMGECLGIDKDGTLLLADQGKVMRAFAGMAKVIFKENQ